MSRSPLSRIAGPVAIVAGISVILTRLVIMATIPPDLAGVQAAVLAPAYAINGPLSILAFAAPRGRHLRDLRVGGAKRPAGRGSSVSSRP